MSVFVFKRHFWRHQIWRHLHLQYWAKFSIVHWGIRMIRAKNDETVSKFVKVLPWHLHYVSCLSMHSALPTSQPPFMARSLQLVVVEVRPLCRRRRRGRFPCIFGGWLKSPPTTPDYHRLVRAGAKWPARPLINYCLVDSLRLHRRLRIIKMFFSGHSVDYWSTAAIVSVRIYIYVFCVLYR